MNDLTELQLDSGWTVRCRPVPPLLAAGMMTKAEFQYPAPPTIDVKVQKGRTTETVSAPLESPEMEKFLRECQAVDDARNHANQQFTFSYGVVDWKGGDVTKFSRFAPKDWKPDAVIKEVFGDIDRRVMFIMGVLIATNHDLFLVQKAIIPSEGDLISGGETQAGEDSFRGDVQEV